MERGRPRGFDEEHALDAALEVFWRSGYQGASMAELTHAMEISKPSLYAAFGNKEQLYLKVLERYREQQLVKHAEALASEPDLKVAMRKFLRSVATMLTAQDLPGGCMVVNSAVACDLPTLPKGVLGAIHRTVEQFPFGLLKEKIRDGLRHRESPDDNDIEQLADYFAAFMCGMAVMAKLGISQERLFGSIEHALCTLSD